MAAGAVMLLPVPLQLPEIEISFIDPLEIVEIKALLNGKDNVEAAGPVVEAVPPPPPHPVNRADAKSIVALINFFMKSPPKIQG